MTMRCQSHRPKCPVRVARTRQVGHSARRRGFTLIEATLSMATMIVILGGIGAAMALSSQSVTTRDNAQAELRSGADILAAMSDELRYATALSTASTEQIEFTVTRGGSNRTIHYVWSGESGDPLTKRIDAGAEADVLTNVDGFELSYSTSVPRQPQSEAESGDETTLTSHDPAANQDKAAIKPQEWVGQCWSLKLPEDTTSWCITRVQFLANSKGEQKGALAVQIRPATDAGTPGSTILESFSLAESSLGTSLTWQDVSFSDVRNLSPDDDFCLVLGVATSDADVAEVAFDNGTGSGYVTSKSSGFTWSAESGKAVQHVLYGKIKTRPPPEEVSEVVDQIRIKLTPSETDVPLHALVTTLNQPAFSKNP